MYKPVQKKGVEGVVKLDLSSVAKQYSIYGILILVAEWIHFTLFGIISPTVKLKVYRAYELSN